MAHARKLKPLKPSLREKKRYLVIEWAPQGTPVDGSRMLQKISTVLGQVGAAKAGLVPIMTNPAKNRLIVRTSTAGLTSVQASLLFLDQIMVRSVGTSGMLHKAKQLLEM